MEKRLIDANALLESFDVAWMVEYDETGCGVSKKAIPTKTIEEAPTIDAVEVTHAGLIETGMDEAWCSWGDCTNCGYSNIMGSKYCNECGAKLDGGAEG